MPLTCPDNPSPTHLRIVRWHDPVVDAHGVPADSRYVELYWLGVIGPSSTWLLRRISYGLEAHPEGCALDLAETAKALGLGERLSTNAPLRRSLQRLCTFDLARPQGPTTLAVRTTIPPLPLRYVDQLPSGLQQSHRAWVEGRRLPAGVQQARRAHRLALELRATGRSAEEIERQLGRWHVHPAIAFRAAEEATLAPSPARAV